MGMKPLGSILLEGLVVALVGATLALAANALSSRGLPLKGDPFHMRTPSVQAGSTNSSPAAPAPAPATNTLLETVAEMVKAKGLTLIDSNRVAELYHDPRYEQDQIIFIDARNEDEYRKGHIPGAFLFDNIYYDKYAPTVLPACEHAWPIMVYCHGGDSCDASINASLTLRQLGVPKERLLLYGGGFTEWETNGLPVEIGERKSGRLRPAAK